MSSFGWLPLWARCDKCQRPVRFTKAVINVISLEIIYSSNALVASRFLRFLWCYFMFYAFEYDCLTLGTVSCVQEQDDDVSTTIRGIKSAFSVCSAA